MNLNIPGGGTLAFAMMANGNAKFMRSMPREGMEQSVGHHGKNGHHCIQHVQITGDYALVWTAWTARTIVRHSRRFTSNGAGTFTNGASDCEPIRVIHYLESRRANYVVTDTVSGRGIMNLPPLVEECQRTLTYLLHR